MPYLNPYQDGENAFYIGKHLTDNPYYHLLEEHHLWNEGFQDAQMHHDLQYEAILAEDPFSYVLDPTEGDDE